MPRFEMIIAIAVRKAMIRPNKKYFQNQRKNNLKLVKQIFQLLSVLKVKV